jgi:hypothetical protein
VEKALVIKEKKTQYMVMERDCLTLCRHPGIVKLTATFQVCRIFGALVPVQVRTNRETYRESYRSILCIAHLPLMVIFVPVSSVHPPHSTDILPVYGWDRCDQVLAASSVYPGCTFGSVVLPLYELLEIDL